MANFVLLSLVLAVTPVTLALEKIVAPATFSVPATFKLPPTPTPPPTTNAPLLVAFEAVVLVTFKIELLPKVTFPPTRNWEATPKPPDNINEPVDTLLASDVLVRLVIPVTDKVLLIWVAPIKLVAPATLNCNPIPAPPATCSAPVLVVVASVLFVVYKRPVVCTKFTAVFPTTTLLLASTLASLPNAVAFVKPVLTTFALKPTKVLLDPVVIALPAYDPKPTLLLPVVTEFSAA